MTPMKKICLIASLVLAGVCASGKTTKTFTVEEGGSGPYKAEIVEDNELPGYTIVKPVNLDVAVSVEGKLPVMLFGNGGCMRNSWAFHNFLTHIASHGYVVVTNGLWSSEPPRMGPPPGEQRPPQRQEQSREEMLEQMKKAEAGNAADARDYLRVLDWLEKQDTDEKSEYFGKVDVYRTVASGQSCGGLQALILGTSGDPRIKTTMPLNSGGTSPGDGLAGMISKDDLVKLNGPVCYLIGGKTDIAYLNAADDYSRIKHVPVVVANVDAGHGGTYSQPHGGSFSDMALLWLDWQLKGKNENEYIFRYAQVPTYLEGWTMVSKNFDEEIIIPIGNDRPAENTEEVSRNEYGEVTGYRKVNDPTVTVRLPKPEDADGSAVVIFPGGALVSLTWEAEFERIADWLNARGVAAVGVKYRLKSSFDMMPPMPAPADGGEKKPAGLRAQIFDFVNLRNANTSPGGADFRDPAADIAAEDALNTMRLINENAGKWNIDPKKTGWMGFSAGGGVALAAMMSATDDLMPAFICSVYGPSLIDITVPENAPKLYVAVNADHMNVAAGCMALFMEWQKAGAESEIHVYNQNSGGVFATRPGEVAPKRTPEGYWLYAFYNWMVANGFSK